jgi:hypothetical protein
MDVCNGNDYAFWIAAWLSDIQCHVFLYACKSGWLSYVIILSWCASLFSISTSSNKAIPHATRTEIVTKNATHGAILINEVRGLNWTLQIQSFPLGIKLVSRMRLQSNKVLNKERGWKSETLILVRLYLLLQLPKVALNIIFQSNFCCIN